MAPDQIRELVIMSYKAFDAGNRDFVKDLFDDDIVWTFNSAPEALPVPLRIKGKTKVLAALKAIDLMFGSIKNRIETLVVENDTAAIIVDTTLMQRLTGRVIRYRTAAFQRYRAGRLVDYTAFVDGVDMLQQALGRELELPAAYPP